MSDIDTAAAREVARRLYYSGPEPSGPYKLIEDMCDEIDRLHERLDRAANLCGRAGALCVRGESS